MSNDKTPLEWQRLVELVNDGQYEPVDQSGIPEFMYLPGRHVFISDPALIRDILLARTHKLPFFLIGATGTGKNIFLELVAAAPGGVRYCIDENVDGRDEGAMVSRFFGPGGVVDSHRDESTLIHFDLLQNALDWPWFADTLHALARSRVLYRTDGQRVGPIDVRVVGGATVDLSGFIATRSESSFGHLYNHLAVNQLARTYDLSDRTSRIGTILGEILATQFLSKRATRDQIEKIQTISRSALTVLENHTWPGRFNELVMLVGEAVARGSWEEAIARNIKCRIFVIWSTAHQDEARRLVSMLRAAQFPTFFSPDSLGAGDWQAQLEKQLERTDYVVACVSRRIFEYDIEGVNLTEIRETLTRASKMNRPFIIPVVVDTMHVRDLDELRHALPEWVRDLKNQQWFWVDTNTGAGFPKLEHELLELCHELRRTHNVDSAV